MDILEILLEIETGNRLDDLRKSGGQRDGIEVHGSDAGEGDRRREGRRIAPIEED